MSVRDVIPKIEGFQPIPNAVMIPFMEAQSAALAYGFGLNYEYGKRKVRSMSNDEFNSLTSEDITNMSNNHTHIILSQFQLQVPKVMPMQQEIFKQYVEIEKAKVLQNVELAKWIVANAPQIIFEGEASSSASGIRKTPPPLTPTGNIIGYIDGKPQYGVPAPPTTNAPSRRTSETASANAVKAKFKSARTLELEIIQLNKTLTFNTLTEARQKRHRTSNAHLTATIGRKRLQLQAQYKTFNKAQESHRSQYGTYVKI